MKPKFIGVLFVKTLPLARTTNTVSFSGSRVYVFLCSLQESTGLCKTSKCSADDSPRRVHRTNAKEGKREQRLHCFF